MNAFLFRWVDRLMDDGSLWAPRPRRPRARHRGRMRGRQLQAERLEDRLLLTVGVAARESAEASLQYLRTVMDQYHNRFPVYDDVSSAGNHFHAYAMLPSQNAPVMMKGSWTENPRSGATAIRAEFGGGPGQQGGYYFQNGTLSGDEKAPQPNFGTVAEAGIDLSGATALTFWARGEVGGERIDFFVAGVGRDPGTGLPTAPHPDSSPRVPPVGALTQLTTEWQQFTIPLGGADLSYVLGGFGWYATSQYNPGGAIFYLDDIQFELDTARLEQRLNEPRFLRSFTTLPVQPEPEDPQLDLVLRNTAFTYDNALALLAFLADGSEDSLRRARLIGDAFVYATENDRSFDDGRLRSAYAAGDLALPPGWNPNGRSGTTAIPGFYVEQEDGSTIFQEVEQKAIDTGNNAWAMIALLELYQRVAGLPGVDAARYLDAAQTLGNFIRTFRADTGTYQGFLGGIVDPESSSPTRRPWASSEHNLDVYAAFTTMGQITGDASWHNDAQHAQQFVEAMWDGSKGCYLAGTSDSESRNTDPYQLPLDVQAWSVLALPGALALHPSVLGGATEHHRTREDGFSGFDFNNDKDGI